MSCNPNQIHVNTLKCSSPVRRIQVNLADLRLLSTVGLFPGAEKFNFKRKIRKSKIYNSGMQPFERDLQRRFSQQCQWAAELSNQISCNFVCIANLVKNRPVHYPWNENCINPNFC